jgi:hypothetical protein
VIFRLSEYDEVSLTLYDEVEMKVGYVVDRKRKTRRERGIERVTRMAREGRV